MKNKKILSREERLARLMMKLQKLYPDSIMVVDLKVPALVSKTNSSARFPVCVGRLMAKHRRQSELTGLLGRDFVKSRTWSKKHYKTAVAKRFVASRWQELFPETLIAFDLDSGEVICITRHRAWLTVCLTLMARVVRLGVVGPKPKRAKESKQIELARAAVALELESK